VLYDRDVEVNVQEILYGAVPARTPEAVAGLSDDALSVLRVFKHLEIAGQEVNGEKIGRYPWEATIELRKDNKERAVAAFAELIRHQMICVFPDSGGHQYQLTRSGSDYLHVQDRV